MSISSVKRGEIFGLLGPNGAGNPPPSNDVRPAGAHLRQSAGAGNGSQGQFGARASIWAIWRKKFSLYGNLSVEQTCAFSPAFGGLRGRAQMKKSPG
nr:hypothetical protein [Klebsiella pneumoniae subsp. pneumoniae]